MPSSTTITIQQTLNWCAAFIVGRPSSGVLGFANEPGLTTANKIIGTILAPPFKWSWNRKETSALTTIQGTTDYALALASFGYLEKAVYANSALNPSQKEIQVYQEKPLSIEAKQGPPSWIMPVFDDNNGNVTFRVLPAPDFPGSPQVNYGITLTYQQSPTLLTALSQTWAPIPDKLAYLYETAMLAHLQGMYSAQLFGLGMEMFFRQLVGAAEGLSETEKNIFLEDKLRELRMQTTEMLGAQQGRRARP